MGAPTVVKLPTASQPDVVTATITDAWWSNEVDNDGDGYTRTASLHWNPDVDGGEGPLTVYERVYFKPASSSTWIGLAVTGSHTITGTSTADQWWIDVDGGSGPHHEVYDFKIDIYRVGQAGPDYSRWDANDTSLNDYRLEGASDDLAFTDHPLASRASVVKAVHVTELRTAISALRVRYKLGPFAWTDPTVLPRETVVKAVHLDELRTALTQVYGAAGSQLPEFTPDPVVGGQTLISAAAILELRAAVIALW